MYDGLGCGRQSVVGEATCEDRAYMDAYLQIWKILRFVSLDWCRDAPILNTLGNLLL